MPDLFEVFERVLTPPVVELYALLWRLGIVEVVDAGEPEA